MAALSKFGESWDEAWLYEYGEQSINAYRSLFNPEIPMDFGDDNLLYSGPEYFMGMLDDGAWLAGDLSLGTGNPFVAYWDLWHSRGGITIRYR